MPTCTECGQPHGRYRDAAHTKPASYCTTCHAAYMRANRPTYAELTDEQKTRANARSYASVYQRRGLLQKQPCECCGNPEAEKHHTDYSQPLLVKWLCRVCHLNTHADDSGSPRGTISCEKLAA